MNADSVTEAEILSWIEKSLDKNGFKNYEINITGKSGKGDGYGSEIIFVSVTETTNVNNKKSMHWVIKHAKKNEHLRNTIPIKECFHNEICVYDKIFPIFKQLEFHRNIQDGFDSVPKCYNTFILDNMEVLVLDNLKELGYELHDKKQSFNICHLKVVLKEYGKLHALSFAVREQRPEEFNKLANLTSDVYKKFFKTESGKESVRLAVVKAKNILKENNELHLLEKLEKIMIRDPADILLDLVAEKEPQSVIIHGDSWNNNFMFRYEDAHKTTPTDVAILDWQGSVLRSPVFDLSCLIYLNSSSNELNKFDELLQFYYTSFSNFLKELGSNSEEIFSYSSLEEHWRKYSLAGLLIALMSLPLVLCDKEDAPVLENFKEGEKFSDLMRPDIKDMDLYFAKVKMMLSHYFEHAYK